MHVDAAAPYRLLGFRAKIKDGLKLCYQLSDVRANTGTCNPFAARFFRHSEPAIDVIFKSTFD
jgi:hypothetical protein